MNKIVTDRKGLLTLMLVAFALYANTLFHDYALDDTLVITGNSFTQKGFAGIPDILTHEGFVGFFGDDSQLIAGGRYRPLAQISFAVEYAFFGLSPFVGHLFNIVYFMLSCALLFGLLKKLFPDKKERAWYLQLPFLATLIFVVHPLHTEVVANIKGRDEIFALLGALAALWFALRCTESKAVKHKVGLGLSFVFALFSKENAITFLAVIPLTLFFFTEASWKIYREVMLALLMATAVFLWARYQALGFWMGEVKSLEILNNPFIGSSLSQRLATVLLTWLMYFKLLFIPYPLTHDYYPFQIPIVDFGDPRVMITLLLLALLAYYVLRNFRQKGKLVYAVLFFFITFSISSNLLINIGTFMNERFLYMPSVGFALGIAYLCAEKFLPWLAQRGKGRWGMALGLLLCTAFGVQAVARNQAWKDDFTLFTTDVKTSPNSAKVTVSAGGKMTEEAERMHPGPEREALLIEANGYLQKGIQLHPTNHQAWFLLGNNYREMGRMADALLAYQQALAIYPDFSEAQNNLLFSAQQSKHKEQFQDAVLLYPEALKYYPEEVGHWNDYADCLLALKKVDSADAVLSKTLAKFPEQSATLNKKAEIAGMYRHNLPQALEYLKKAYAVDSTYLTTNENLGIVYGMMQQCERSIFYFRKALEKDSTNERIRENLASTYEICGRRP